MQVKMDSKSIPGTTIIGLSGKLDTLSADDFSETVYEIFENGGFNTLRFDCKDLDYVSSAGLRVFLSAKKTADGRNLSVELCNLSQSILEIFEVTGFNSIFTILK
ncbi:anti-sigma factor antagonist [Fibrobacterales bacterium]|nr:anti-sigma factor antagonist [Fibrobacterales bacterium]